MLQQNNNNNSVCVDMTHRELLQSCGRSAPLSFGTIGFGAIPLIKGLRAWAVSGAFTPRNKRRSAEEEHSHQPDTQRGWRTKESLSSVRSPGALVTVATLKGSEGVRQTQTRCLFLRAEGCSYICTVGPRTTGQPGPAEALSSGRGRRASQEEAGGCKVRPQVIRKWRKSSKVFKSAESKDGGASSKTEQRQAAKRDLTSQVEASDCPSHCLKTKHRHTSVQLPVNKSPGEGEQTNTSSKDSTSVYLRQDVSRGSADEVTARASVNLTPKTKRSHPEPKELSPESEQLMQVNDKITGATENINKSYGETSKAGVSRTSSNDLLTGTDMRQESHTGTSSPENRNTVGVYVTIENEQVKEDIHPEDMKKEKDLHLVRTCSHDSAGVNKAIHPEEMEKDDVLTVARTKSPNVGGQCEMSMHCLLMDKDEDEVLTLVQTKSPLKDSGHDHLGIGCEAKARMDKDDNEAMDMSSTKSPEENPGQEHHLAGVGNGSRARIVKDSFESDQSEVVIHLEKDKVLTTARTKRPVEDPHDHTGIESGCKTKMDEDSIKTEIGQSGVSIDCLLMSKDEDPVDHPVEDPGQPDPEDHEVVKIGSKLEQHLTKTENDCSEKDEDLDTSTKSPVEGPGQGHDPEKVASGSKSNTGKDLIKSKFKQSEKVVHSLKVKKDKQVLLVKAYTNSFMTIPDQERVESGSKSKMDEDRINNENGQYEEASDITSTKSPFEDDGESLTGLTGVESGPEARIEKDLVKCENDLKEMEKDDDLDMVDLSLSNAKMDNGQPEDIVHSLKVKKDEEELLVNAFTNSFRTVPGHVHDLEKVESGSKSKMEEDRTDNENGQYKKASDMTSTKSLLEDHDQSHGPAEMESGLKARIEKDLGVTKAKIDNSELEDGIHSLNMEKDGEEPRVTANINSSRTNVHDLASVKSGSKSKIEEDRANKENGQYEEMNKYEVFGMTSTKSPLEDDGRAGVESGPEARIEMDLVELEKVDDLAMINTNSPKNLRVSKAKMDSGQPEEDIYSDFLDSGSTEGLVDDPGSLWCQHVNSSDEHWFANSSSPKAYVTLVTVGLLNPDFTSTTATAEASPALEEEVEQEVGAGFNSLRPQAESQLLSEQKKSQKWSKVAEKERPVEVSEEEEEEKEEEEEEEEFGVFMQAEEEHKWMDEFNQLQQVPSVSLHDNGYRNSSDDNESVSWTSDWTGVQPVDQSDDTWAAFKQEDDSRGAESEEAGQWWSSTAEENSHLPLSPYSVFQEVFPCVGCSSADSDSVLTLEDLLRPAENNTRTQKQSLLDGLQDLDRMIDVKYKGAESLSHKLLLQSLHLGSVSCDGVSGRKQASARFSPNLPTSNQQLVANANAKRRLSYDINRNITA